MARATGTIAPGSQGACRISFLELSGSKCVTTTEVGGLLKKAVSLETTFQEAAFLDQPQRKIAATKEHKGTNLSLTEAPNLSFTVCAFCASLWLNSVVLL